MSSCAGILDTTFRYSPGTILALWGAGTAAFLQRWSEVSSRKDADFEPLDAKNEVRPRDFLARIILSNSWTTGESAGVISRSWMNSLKAMRMCEWSPVC